MNARSRTFQNVLASAIDDILTHGYSDVSRMNDWLRRLRLAALMDMTPSSAVDTQIRLSMEAALRRATTKTAVERHHPGVGKFTIDRIAPQLRPVLDRRITASANLIKLNREEAIEKTIRRFSGWASSVPDGGTRAADRPEIKADVGKPLKQLSFEERRVVIDQGHKLVSSVNAVIAQQTGAIAMRWRSHWRQSGYHFRPDHKERDQQIYLIRDSWAAEQGLVKKGVGYVDEITAPAEEPFCRCYGVYITALRDMPEDMLTAKGKQLLEDTRLRKRDG